MKIYYEKKNLELSRLCDKYGSDKGSDDLTKPKPYKWHPHTYTYFYSTLFDHCRENFKKIFECGIGTSNENIPSNLGKDYKPGTSLRVWKDYFKNAAQNNNHNDKHLHNYHSSLT